jgi:hypothetical protein
MLISVYCVSSHIGGIYFLNFQRRLSFLIHNTDSYHAAALSVKIAGNSFRFASLSITFLLSLLKCKPLLYIHR